MKEITTSMPTVTYSKGKSLKDEDLRRFRELGFLVVEGVLDPEEDIRPLEEEYTAILDREIEALFAAGKLSSLYKDLPFLERFARAFCEGGLSHQPFDICLPPKVSRTTPIHLGPAVFHHILRNPRILDLVEELIGPEIYSNPVQHVRIKPPQNKIEKSSWHPLVAQTPWHQDLGVISEDADSTEIITIWVAVTEATTENSCLMVIPGSHKGDLAPHCPLVDDRATHKPTGIPKQFLDETMALRLPVPAGAAIIFDKKVIHGALPNKTDSIRWSFDLRFNRTGEPTGRSWFPGFVARSRANPESELRNADVWALAWREAIASLTKDGEFNRSFTRWSADHPACA